MVFWTELEPDSPEIEIPYNAEADIELWCGDSHTLMRNIPDDVATLVIFSPPYDAMRKYNGEWNIDLHEIGVQSHRILHDGGVAVIVIQDQTFGGTKSLTSIRTTLDWCDNIGFNLFEMLVFSRHGAPGNQSNYRFRVDHEYMPVFVKGDKPAEFHPEHMATRALSAGKQYSSGAGRRYADGTMKYGQKIQVADTTSRGTIWHYNVAWQRKNALKYAHPATYPDRLAYDHVLCWTAPEDLVVDPFVGSGSTAVACLATKRQFIGIDISQAYIDLARKRCRT